MIYDLCSSPKPHWLVIGIKGTDWQILVVYLRCGHATKSKFLAPVSWCRGKSSFGELKFHIYTLLGATCFNELNLYE